MATDQITTTLVMKPELRPCIIREETKALFHGWEQWANTVPAEITIGGAPGGQVARVYGIIELGSGETKRAEIGDIRFLDSKARFEERRGGPDEEKL